MTVTYELDERYTLAEVHLWMGETELPMRKGVPTASPGQFPYSPEIATDGLSATFTLCSTDAGFDLEDGLWVAAHAVVSWCEYDSRAVDEIEAALGNSG